MTTAAPNTRRALRARRTPYIRDHHLVSWLVLTCGRGSRGRQPALSWPSYPESPTWLCQRPSKALACSLLAVARWARLGRTGGASCCQPEKEGTEGGERRYWYEIKRKMKNHIKDREKTSATKKAEGLAGWEGHRQFEIRPKRFWHIISYQVAICFFVRSTPPPPSCHPTNPSPRPQATLGRLRLRSYPEYMRCGVWGAGGDV